MHTNSPQISQTSSVEQLLQLLLRFFDCHLCSHWIPHKPILSSFHLHKFNLKLLTTHKASALLFKPNLTCSGSYGIILSVWTASVRCGSSITCGYPSSACNSLENISMTPCSQSSLRTSNPRCLRGLDRLMIDFMRSERSSKWWSKWEPSFTRSRNLNPQTRHWYYAFL